MLKTICLMLAGTQLCFGFKIHNLITCELKVQVVVSLRNPKELFSFHRLMELANLDPWHMKCSPLIGRHIWVVKTVKNLPISYRPIIIRNLVNRTWLMTDFSGISDKFVRARVCVMVGYNCSKIKDHLLWVSLCHSFRVIRNPLPNLTSVMQA